MTSHHWPTAILEKKKTLTLNITSSNDFNFFVFPSLLLLASDWVVPFTVDYMLTAALFSLLCLSDLSSLLLSSRCHMQQQSQEWRTAWRTHSLLMDVLAWKGYITTKLINTLLMSPTLPSTSLLSPETQREVLLQQSYNYRLNLLHILEVG